MARKRNSKPGVFKRGDTWSFKVSYVDPSGRYKQIWRGGFRTQDEANAERIDTLARRNSGIDVNPKRLTIAAYLDRWLREYAEQRKTKTYAGYRALFDHHVKPVIGTVLLTKLRPLQVQAVYSAMRKKGLAEKTILNTHRPLSEALKQAVHWELRFDNPAERVAAPKPEDYEPVVLSIEEVRAALVLTDDSTRGTLVRFAVYSGLRQGEMIGLKWPKVDFANGWVTVPRVTTKSKAGARTIPLTADALELLRQHRYRQMQERDALGLPTQSDGYVFAQPDGSPLTAKMAEGAWGRIRKALATEARFHDLRHTNASILLHAGVPMKVVQERLGHASYQVTADVYSHLVPGLGLNDVASERFDALLRTPVEENGNNE